MSGNGSLAGFLAQLGTLSVVWALTAAADSALPPPGADVPAAVLQQWQARYEQQAQAAPGQAAATGGHRAAPGYLNALALEHSPYLLQHATNPVNWLPWAQPSFELARSENKLILLSIGYSTCHWCHVMNRESFSDPAIAAFINRHFVAIKVDREQHPAVDQYYAELLELVKGTAGWPLTAILDSRGEPLLLEAYLKPAELQGLLTRVVELAQRQPEFLAQSAQFMASLSGSSRAPTQGDSRPLSLAEYQSATAALLTGMDSQYGGIAGDQKFPNEAMILLLLDALQRDYSPRLQSAIERQLDNMLQGGLHDQIHGGFFRYATDRRWQIPHFEKMLYNQALLLQVYSRAYELTAKPQYRWAVQRLLHFLEQWLHTPGTGYYAAIDAESDGREGHFYLVDEARLAGIAEPDRAAAGLTLNPMPGRQGEFVAAISHPDTAAAQRIRTALQRAGQERTPPFVDRKVITAWNAALLSGLAAAHRATRADGEPPLVTRSQLEALGNQLWAGLFGADNAVLVRTHFEGQPGVDAGLEDYAWLLQATIDLYDATGNTLWLQRGRVLATQLLAGFLAEDGSFSLASLQQNRSIAKQPATIRDAELPAADAVAVGALWQLGQRQSDSELARRLKPAIGQLRAKIRDQAPAQYSATRVLADIDLGAVSLQQYFAGGRGVARLTLPPVGGDCSAAELQIELASGWHVNSAAPLQDYLIPTRVSVNTADGDPVAAVYPEGTVLALGFQPEPLSIYEGAVTIVIKGQRTKQWLPGAAFDIALQACSDQLCLPPETLIMRLPPALATNQWRRCSSTF